MEHFSGVAHSRKKQVKCSDDLWHRRKVKRSHHLLTPSAGTMCVQLMSESNRLSTCIQVIISLILNVLKHYLLKLLNPVSTFTYPIKCPITNLRLLTHILKGIEPACSCIVDFEVNNAVLTQMHSSHSLNRNMMLCSYFMPHELPHQCQL